VVELACMTVIFLVLEVGPVRRDVVEVVLEGYLAHTKLSPPRALQLAYP